MTAKLTQKALNQLAVDHMVSFVNSHAALQVLPAKMDKLFSNLPIVLLAPTRVQALELFNTLKNDMGFKNLPGFAGLLQNVDENIELHFNRVDAKGRKLDEARVADLKDPANEYILVTIITHDYRKLGQPVDPAVSILRGLNDLGGTVKPYADHQWRGAVVDFPKSMAGTNSIYGGISDEHTAARGEIVKRVEALAGVAPGTFKSIYKDSFSLANFYNANPGTPKWFIVRFVERTQ